MKLEQLNPNASLSVELPHSGNGGLYQARTTISDGLVFYGRAESEDEAVMRCCQKAVKHLIKNNAMCIAPMPQQHPPSLMVSRPPIRRPAPVMEVEKCRKKISECEKELRNEMADVLDRVAQWSSRYAYNNVSSTR